MKPLKPDCSFDLDHRAYFLHGWPRSSRFLAASKDGHVSLVDTASKTTEVYRPTKELRAIGPHPTKPLIAWVDGNSGFLVVQDLNGNSVAQVRPPEFFAGSSMPVEQGFANCHFDESGDFLWLAAPLSADKGELLLVETEGWSVVHRAVVKDPFGASYWSFYRTGRPGLVSLWLAAGQDGQQVYWLNRNGKTISIEKAEGLTDCIPPIFSPDGSEFLVATDYTICRYDFLKMKLIGSSLGSGDKDNPFVESLSYLDDRHALK
jgi:hypothetical protein